MEIQKIFSDLYDGERLYSVLMSEEEIYLFSEFQKEFGSIKRANKAAKRAWEISQLGSSAPRKYIADSATGKTILNLNYNKQLGDELQRFRKDLRKKPGQNGILQKIENDKVGDFRIRSSEGRKNIRQAIKNNLASGTNTQDVINSLGKNKRGVNKSKLRKIAMKEGPTWGTSYDTYKNKKFDLR